MPQIDDLKDLSDLAVISSARYSWNTRIFKVGPMDLLCATAAYDIRAEGVR